MNIRELQNFVCLAECLNFTEAAKCLYMSQPTLSRQIAELENELGVRLFARTRRTVEMTEAGEEFLVFARRIVENGEEMLKRSRRLTDGMRFKLNVGYPGAFDIDMTAEILGSIFKKCGEGIDICLSSQGIGTLMSDLEVGKLDAVLTSDIGVAAYPDMETLNIASAPVKLLVPAEHELAARERVSLKELGEYRFVMLSSNLWPLEYAHLHELCEKEGVSVDVIQYAESLDAVLLYVLMGKGLTILVTDAVHYSRNRLKCIELDGGDQINVVLAWRKGSLNPALREFIKAAGE